MSAGRDFVARVAIHAELCNDRLYHGSISGFVHRARAAVVFDLDGVLVDSTAVVERAWRRWAAAHEVSAGDVLAIAHGRPSRDVVRAFAPHLDAETEAALLDGWEAADTTGLVAVPGASACVSAVRGGSWAIATSGGRSLALGRLAAAKLPVPDVLVTADDVHAGKPDPEPYLRAADALAVSPEDCIVVEDAPAGVIAAQRAGMAVIAVCTTHTADDLAGADVVCQGMADVLPHLSAAVNR
jgi:sugar-phosphatase